MMKIRIAKKIMGYNPNCKFNKGWYKKLRKLRPPYTREDGVVVFPSAHDVDIIRRARVRLFKWVRKDK